MARRRGMEKEKRLMTNRSGNSLSKILAGSRYPWHSSRKMQTGEGAYYPDGKGYWVSRLCAARGALPGGTGGEKHGGGQRTCSSRKGRRLDATVTKRCSDRSANLSAQLNMPSTFLSWSSRLLLSRSQYSSRVAGSSLWLPSPRPRNMASALYRVRPNSST